MPQLRDDILLQRVSLLLKKIREEKKLTQLDVYNDTNIHVGRIEADQDNITLSTLSLLCNYFGLSLSDFLKQVEEM